MSMILKHFTLTPDQFNEFITDKEELLDKAIFYSENESVGILIDFDSY